MAILNYILSTKTYYYFDKCDRLKTKELNVFQCYLRRRFGFYQETHLLTAAGNGYRVTLTNKAPNDEVQKQQLLTLMKKAHDVFETTFNIPGEKFSEPFYAPFSCWKGDDGKSTLISMRYQIEKFGEQLQLKGIDFQVTLASKEERSDFNFSLEPVPKKEACIIRTKKRENENLYKDALWIFYNSFFDLIKPKTSEIWLHQDWQVAKLLTIAADKRAQSPFNPPADRESSFNLDFALKEMFLY